MDCGGLAKALDSVTNCDATDSGLRFRSHCLFPSLQQVDVFVAKIGEEYRVHDGGGAFREAWLHGRNETLILHSLRREAERHHLVLSEGVLSTESIPVAWLPSAVISVANAAATAATHAIERLNAASEDLLSDRIEKALRAGFGSTVDIHRDFHERGTSGKEYIFDFAIRIPQTGLIIINSITSHHVAIASKFMAFSDTPIPRNNKIAIYDKPLARDDVALLQHVCSLMPITSASDGILGMFANKRQFTGRPN